ncbi:MAG: MFS transporter [Candidatus Thorarchaeota archaeon]|nr:MFS transporter [Candidatus Thorarchaeota archaeon]
MDGEPLERDVPDPEEKKPGWRQSLKDIFSWRNYTVYLLTAWIFNAMAALWSFFNLYLRTLQWDFMTIVAALSAVALVSVFARLIGGYVGDVIDRKKLAVVAMLMTAVYSLIIGLFTDFSFVFIGLIILGMNDIAKGGASAYIMDNIPSKHSGLALSLFMVGRSLGTVTILVFLIIEPILGFAEAFRHLYLLTGVFLLICAAARAYYLDPNPQKGRVEGTPLWKDFVTENRQAIGILVRMMPGVLVVVIIDSLSDSLFEFGALIYTNEILGVSYQGIAIMMFVYLVILTPLLLKTGRMSDTTGARRAALTVYIFMPICAGLLLIAPIFPQWAPEWMIVAADARMEGLGVIFTTPFLAIVIKMVTDILWYTILLALIRKRIPRKDTAKILAMFWAVVYLCQSIGPLIGGIVFTYAEQYYLFVIVLGLNLLILGALAKNGLVSDEADAPESQSPEE